MGIWVLLLLFAIIPQNYKNPSFKTKKKPKKFHKLEHF